jgi:hypothetical protein
MIAQEHDDHEPQAPSGLPDGAREGMPLGPSHADPDGEGERKRGPGQMPGIPDDGEPPSSG